jgi:hypothetical protein
VCESTIYLKNPLVYADGQGVAATTLYNFQFSVIRFGLPGSNKEHILNSVVNFNPDNRTVNVNSETNLIYVKFLDRQGRYLSAEVAGVTAPIVVNIGLRRNPGDCFRAAGHQAQTQVVGDVFVLGAVSYEITQQPMVFDQVSCY